MNCIFGIIIFVLAGWFFAYCLVRIATISDERKYTDTDE